MTSREYFDAASEAVRELDRIRERMEQRTYSMYFHGRSGQTLSHGVVLDPMRNVDEAMDANAEDEEAASSCESEIEDAWRVVGGVSTLYSDEAAQILCRHYLWLEEWSEISEAMDKTETECQAIMEVTLDWCDVAGIARLREAGRNRDQK